MSESGRGTVIASSLTGSMLVVLAVSLIHTLYVLWPPPVAGTTALVLLERRAATSRLRARGWSDSVRKDSTAVARDTADTAAARRLAAHRAELRAAHVRAAADSTTADTVAANVALASLQPDSVAVFGGLGNLSALTSDVRLILLALVAGALGSLIYMAQSFATYVGNRTFRASWVWWYLLRPIIGGLLAVILYLVIRGALFSTTLIASGDVNPFGVASLAALAGLFSKQAVDKLSEVFDTVFRTASRAGDGARTDKPTVKQPTITRLEPASVSRAAASPVALTVHGGSFVRESVVHLADAALSTRYDGPDRLMIQIDPATLPPAPRSHIDVTVVVPQAPTGVAASTPFKLQITP